MEHKADGITTHHDSTPKMISSNNKIHLILLRFRCKIFRVINNSIYLRASMRDNRNMELGDIVGQEMLLNGDVTLDILEEWLPGKYTSHHK
jgi:hypothetical protein